MRVHIRISSSTIFVKQSFIAFVSANFISEYGTVNSFLSGKRIPVRVLVSGQEHVFEISNLFGVLPILHVLQVLYFLLCKYELVLALLVGKCKFFLEVLHLLYEDFFVFESFLENGVLFLFSLEVEF